MLFDPSKLLLVFTHKSFALSVCLCSSSLRPHNPDSLCVSVSLYLSISGMDPTRPHLKSGNSVATPYRRVYPPLPIRSSSNSTATSAQVASLCCIITVTSPLITSKDLVPHSCNDPYLFDIQLSTMLGPCCSNKD